MLPEPEQADELGRLYDRLGPSLYRYALMILADRSGAEDVVHDVFVSTLNDLTPGLLTAIPIDPFSGKAMRFARGAETYVVYSVGPNRTDEGGDQAGTRVVVDDPGRGPTPRMTGDVGVTVKVGLSRK